MKCLMAEVNFSEGRDQGLIDQVRDAMLAGDPIDLMEISSDGDHNRTVFTFKGEPRAVLEASKRLSAKAVELIDMTKQAYEDMVHLKTREERIAYADKMLRGDVLHNMATHETTYNV